MYPQPFTHLSLTYVGVTVFQLIGLSFCFDSQLYLPYSGWQAFISWSIYSLFSFFKWHYLVNKNFIILIWINFQSSLRLICLKNIYFYFLFMCLCESLRHGVQVPAEARRGCQVCWSQSAGGRCWRLNYCPLDEQ